MHPTPAEDAERARVIAALINAIEHDHPIRVPTPGETSQFSGVVGGFQYQFEGEDDLLHIAITRIDRKGLVAEEAQNVVSWLMPEMPAGLIWIRPGEYSQHFYLGHDDVVRYVNRKS